MHLVTLLFFMSFCRHGGSVWNKTSSPGNITRTEDKTENNSAHVIKYPPNNQNHFECCLHVESYGITAYRDVHDMIKTVRSCDRYIDPSLSYKQFKQVLINTISNGLIDRNACPGYNKKICEESTEPLYKGYVAFWVLLFLIASSGNILVCLAYKMTRDLRRNVAHMFVTSLAVSDLLVCIFVIPIKIHTTLHNHKFCMSNHVCRFYYTVEMIFFVASITNLFAVTIDRFVATTFPYAYQRCFTKARAKVILVTVWCYAILWGSFVHFNPKSYNFNEISVIQNLCLHKSDDYFIVLYVIVFIIPFITMYYMYAKMYQIARHHAQQIDLQHKQVRANSFIREKHQNVDIHEAEKRTSSDIRKRPTIATWFNSSSRKAEWKATRLVIMVSSVYVVCWLPMVIIFFVMQFKPINSKYIYVIFSEILPIMHSTCNPFIYAIFHRDFKNALGRIVLARLCPRWGRGKLREANHGLQSKGAVNELVVTSLHNVRPLIRGDDHRE